VRFVRGRSCASRPKRVQQQVLEVIVIGRLRTTAGYRMPSSSERRVFLGIAFAVLAIAIAPIWVTRFLPLLDDPNHLSAIYIWHGLVSGDPSLQAFYELNVVPVAYFAHYGLATLLSFVV